MIRESFRSTVSLSAIILALTYGTVGCSCSDEQARGVKLSAALREDMLKIYEAPDGQSVLEAMKTDHGRRMAAVLDEMRDVEDTLRTSILSVDIERYTKTDSLASPDERREFKSQLLSAQAASKLYESQSYELQDKYFKVLKEFDDSSQLDESHELWRTRTAEMTDANLLEINGYLKVIDFMNNADYELSNGTLLFSTPKELSTMELLIKNALESRSNAKGVASRHETSRQQAKKKALDALRAK